MQKYVRCECGNVVRYKGYINRAGRCPRCEEWLWKGEPVRRREWLEAHGLHIREDGGVNYHGVEFPAL